MIQLKSHNGSPISFNEGNRILIRNIVNLLHDYKPDPQQWLTLARPLELGIKVA